MTALYDLGNTLFVRAAVEVLLNSVWQGVALAGLTFAFLSLTRRANAATRYGVWFATLLVLVAIPLTGVLLAYAGLKETPAVVTVSRTVGAPSAAPYSPQASSAMTAAGPQAHARGDSADGPEATPSLNVSEPFAHVPLQAGRNVELPAGAWLSIFFCGWLLVACVRTGRVLASHRRLRELKRNSAPLPARYQGRLRQFLSSYPRARRTRLAGSTEISMPMAVGLRNPAIIFPLALVGQLTEDEFDQILLHELAHVQRRDDWTNFAQKLIEAILFFHPAALWIGRRLTLEREVACDDHVIRVTKAGRQYAVCLTKLAELTVMPQQGAGLAPGVLQSRKHIFSRVEFLLKKGRDADPHVSKAGLLLTLATLVAASLPCLLMPPVIALAAARAADENTRTQPSAAAGVGAVETVAHAAGDAGETAAAAASEASGEADGARQPSDAVRVASVESGPASDAGNAGATSNELRQRASTAAGGAPGEGDDAALLIEAVSRMSSSSDKTNALVGMVEREANVAAVPAGFFEAVATISSSLDRTRVLSSLLRKGVGRGLLLQTLKAAEGIESDSDKAGLLVKASSICPDDDAALSIYLGVVATLRSSLDKERTLSALLRRPGLSRAILSRVRSLALSSIADPQSRQLVLDRIEARSAG